MSKLLQVAPHIILKVTLKNLTNTQLKTFSNIMKHFYLLLQLLPKFRGGLVNQFSNLI